MSNYLKRFTDHAQYQTYADSSVFKDPNVSICEIENEIHYTKRKTKGIRIRFMERETNPNATTNRYSVAFSPVSKNTYYSSPSIGSGQYKIIRVTNNTTDIQMSKGIGGQGYSDSVFYFSYDNEADVCDIYLERNVDYPLFVNRMQRSSTWYYVYTTFWNVPANNSYDSTKCHYDKYSIIGDLADFFGTGDLASIPDYYGGTYGHLFDANAAGIYSDGHAAYLYEFPKMSSFTSCKEESFLSFFKNQRYASNPVELCITELKSYCFSSMFNGCSNFSDLTVHFTEWEPEGTSDCTANWLSNVSATGVFRCPRALPIERGPSRIPEGWDIEYID